MVTAALFNTLMTGWLAVMGLAIGSFLNVVIARVPHGQSIVRPRSRCPKCGRQLEWYENVPLLSWAIQGGKCRGCRSPISWRYPAVELLTGLLFLACLVRFEWTWELVSALTLVVLLVPLTFIDLEHWLLPFELTLPGIALGVLLALPFGLPVTIDAAIGAAVGFVVFLAMEYVGLWIFKKEALGGGDKYLLALIGAFLGWKPLLGVIFLSSLQGALIGSLLLLVRGRAGPAATEPAPAPTEAHDGEADDWVPGPTNIPFGPWLSIAALEVLLLGPWLSGVLPDPVGWMMFGATFRGMKWRIASVAFLLGVVSTGLTWATLQPVFARLFDSVARHAPPGSPGRELALRLRTLVPLYLGLDALLIALLCYLVLYFTVGRPLQHTEQTLEQLGRLDLDLPFEASGGPLVSRVQASVRRTADALRREKQLTQTQLAALLEKNAQLERAQTVLVASERLATVGKFAAGVAHEVGNPLAGILGYVELAKAPTRRPEEVRDFLDRIEAEVQRIDRIVRGLLDLGRPTRGKPGPLALAPLLRSAAGLVGQSSELREVTVLHELPEDAIVLGEPGPISQIALNLLLNAAQAMGGRGTIRLRAGAGGPGEVVWAVEDEGPGIPPEVLPRIFEPFFTTKAAGKGSGLGLAVCVHLASESGGRIWAENRPEGGARFVVALPSA